MVNLRNIPVSPDRADLIRPYLALGLADRAKRAIEEGIDQHNASLLALTIDLPYSRRRKCHANGSGDASGVEAAEAPVETG